MLREVESLALVHTAEDWPGCAENRLLGSKAWALSAVKMHPLAKSSLLLTSV